MNRYFSNLARRSSLMPTKNIQHPDAVLKTNQADIVTQTIEQVTPACLTDNVQVEASTQRETARNNGVSRHESFSTTMTPIVNHVDETSVLMNTAIEPETLLVNENRFIEQTPHIKTAPLFESSLASDEVNNNRKNNPFSHEQENSHAITLQVSSRGPFEMPQRGSVENAQTDSSRSKIQLSENRQEIQPESAEIEQTEQNKPSLARDEVLITNPERFMAQSQAAAIQQTPNPLLSKKKTETQVNVRIGVIQLDIHQTMQKKTAPVNVMQSPAAIKRDSPPALNLSRHYLRGW